MAQRDEGMVFGPDDGDVETWMDERHGDVTFRTLVSGDRVPSSHLTTGWGELGKDDVFKTHRHTPVETYYIYSGEGTITLDGNTSRIAEGDSVFLPSQVWHSMEATSDTPLRFFFVLDADSLQDVDYEFQEPES